MEPRKKPLDLYPGTLELPFLYENSKYEVFFFEIGINFESSNVSKFLYKNLEINYHGREKRKNTPRTRKRRKSF